MWEIRRSIACWDCFRIPIPLEILQTQSRLREEFCVSWEVERSFPYVGWVRNKLQSPTFQLNLKLCLWMLVCAWMESLELSARSTSSPVRFLQGALVFFTRSNALEVLKTGGPQSLILETMTSSAEFHYPSGFHVAFQKFIFFTRTENKPMYQRKFLCVISYQFRIRKHAL